MSESDKADYEVTYWFDQEHQESADTFNVVTGRHRADKLAEVWGEELSKRFGRRIYTQVKELR